MRTTLWVLSAATTAAVALGPQAGPAAAGESAWSGQAGCGSSQPYAAYGAPACGAPGYGAMVPGCCECPPSRCDHIWDGYCQKRGHCGGWFFCRPTIPYLLTPKYPPIKVVSPGRCVVDEPAHEATSPPATPAAPPARPSPAPAAAEKPIPPE